MKFILALLHPAGMTVFIVGAYLQRQELMITGLGIYYLAKSELDQL